jgi:putative ABC transport system permease protein
MIGNYWKAALAHASGNRLFATINTAGLAIGVATSVLMFVIVHAELTHNDFIPNYRNTYLAVTAVIPSGHPTDYKLQSNHQVAGLLKARFGEILGVTRLSLQETAVRNADVFTKQELVYWADPNVFQILDLPTLQGDLQQALTRPDGVVLTRAMAIKYFNEENVVGRRIEIGGEPMTVNAVIRDLPTHRTELETGIFASGLAAHSELARMDATPNDGGGFNITSLTYFSLAPRASTAAIEAGAFSVMDAIWTSRPASMKVTLIPLRLDQIHLFEGLNPGVKTRIAFSVLIGVLVLFLACVNFVNLSTARATRRAIEVGVRKASGASRPQLMVQFVGESLLFVVVASIFGLAVVELVLPQVDAFLGGGVTFEYGRDPHMLITLAAAGLALGLLAGAYPAFVLSSFRPANVLRGHAIAPEGANALRRILVTLQFAILIGLMITAAVIYRQREFATTDALRVNTDQVLALDMRANTDQVLEAGAACRPALMNELRAIGGVRAVACTGSPLFTAGSFGPVDLTGGITVTASIVPVDSASFDVYGIRPRAGRLFSVERGDAAYAQGGRKPERWVINETAVKAFGFASPEAAVGQTVGVAGEVIGVVEDFSLGSLRKEILPTAYVFAGNKSDQIHLKLAGKQIPETLQAIDAAWRKAGTDQPLNRFFVDEHIRDLYAADLKQAQIFTLFAGVAVLLACLGLFGLSASTTERRVREIGLRKAMGASSGDIMRLLLWQFTQPVLWASLLAWPVVGWLMNRWLDGFAYRIDLELWVFVMATVSAVLVALITVAVHCYLVARAKPAAALKAE